MLSGVNIGRRGTINQNIIVTHYKGNILTLKWFLITTHIIHTIINDEW